MSEMTATTWEQDVSVFIQLMEQGEEAIWAQSKWAFHLTGKYGRKTASMLSKEVGVSKAYIRQMVAVAKAFPEPEDRAADLSFTHHKLAALTDDPEKWINLAVANGWSKRELAEAIKGGHDKISDEEACRQAEERLEQSVRKFNERYGVLSGKKAVLVWEESAQSEETAETLVTALTA